MYHDAMIIALQQAQIAKSKGEDPFGAVLVNSKNEICYYSHSKSIELSDPTAHAELSAIREYCQMIKKVYLADYTIVCSGEPCVMCAGAIKWAKIKRVVFSIPQSYIQKISGGKLKPSCNSIVNTGSTIIEIISEYMFEEGKEIFKDYSFKPKEKRNGI